MSAWINQRGGELATKFAGIELVVFDFDGVFTDNTVWVNQDGIESVRCWRSDGLGLSRLKSIGVNTCIISTEINPVVGVRAKKLAIQCIQGVEDKAQSIENLASSLQISLDKVAFVGNDINDLPALKKVGMPIATADAYPEVATSVAYRTRALGGRGAVREVCDLIFFAKQK